MLLQLEWQVSNVLSSLMPTFDFLFSQQDVITKGSISFQDTLLPRVAVSGV